MEYKTIWIEVDVKNELPESGKWVKVIDFSNVIYKKDNFFYIDSEGEEVKFHPSHWLKRVQIPIYTEQEIKENANNVFEPPPKNYDKYAYRLSVIAWKDGYAAYQEELLKQLK